MLFPVIRVQGVSSFRLVSTNKLYPSKVKVVLEMAAVLVDPAALTRKHYQGKVIPNVEVSAVLRHHLIPSRTLGIAGRRQAKEVKVISIEVLLDPGAMRNKR